ncbi:MAG: hypothetical protein HY794_12685 [Desulfarculus sp.]|nr:hypothetical protein [Desulfarculus sp.]
MRVLELAAGLKQFFEGLSPRQTQMTGWSRLRWGMSTREVAYNFPQAQADPGDANQMTLAPDPPQDLKYSLSFRFGGAGRQLESVTLSFAGSRGVADFAAISQEISARLGAPLSQTETSTTWQRDGGQLTLSKTAQGGVVLNESA